MKLKRSDTFGGMKRREQWFKQHDEELHEIDHRDDQYALGNFQEESRYVVRA